MHRQPPSRDCPVGVNIETVLGDVLHEVDTAVEKVLEGITINDVVQRLKPCGDASTVKVIGKGSRKKQYDRQVSLPQLRAGAKTRRAKALRTA